MAFSAAPVVFAWGACVVSVTALLFGRYAKSQRQEHVRSAGWWRWGGGWVSGCERCWYGGGDDEILLATFAESFHTDNGDVEAGVEACYVDGRK